MGKEGLLGDRPFDSDIGLKHFTRCQAGLNFGDCVFVFVSADGLTGCATVDRFPKRAHRIMRDFFLDSRIDRWTRIKVVLQWKTMVHYILGSFDTMTLVATNDSSSTTR